MPIRGCHPLPRLAIFDSDKRRNLLRGFWFKPFSVAARLVKGSAHRRARSVAFAYSALAYHNASNRGYGGSLRVRIEQRVECTRGERTSGRSGWAYREKCY